MRNWHDHFAGRSYSSTVLFGFFAVWLLPFFLQCERTAVAVQWPVSQAWYTFSLGSHSSCVQCGCFLLQLWKSSWGDWDSLAEACDGEESGFRRGLAAACFLLVVTFCTSMVVCSACHGSRLSFFLDLAALCVYLCLFWFAGRHTQLAWYGRYDQALLHYSLGKICCLILGNSFLSILVFLRRSIYR